MFGTAFRRLSNRVKKSSVAAPVADHPALPDRVTRQHFVAVVGVQKGFFLGHRVTAK